MNYNYSHDTKEILPDVPRPMLDRERVLRGAQFYIQQAITEKPKEDKTVEFSFVPPQTPAPELPTQSVAGLAVETLANDEKAARDLVEEALGGN